LRKENTDAIIIGDMSQDISPVPKGFIPKTLHFFRKHKIIAGILIFIIFIAIARIISLPFVAISFPQSREMHSTGSIAFDKRQMNRVNRIETKCKLTENVTTIVDPTFIRSFVSNTLVATDIAGFNCTFVVYIKLYRGDVLVRKMEVCWLHNCILVYRPSRRHWFFFNFFMPSSNGGTVKLPHELDNYIFKLLIEPLHNMNLYQWR